MNLSLLLFICAMLLPLLLGLVAGKFLRVKWAWPLYISFSFFTGIGLIALWMLILLAFRIPMNLLSVVGPLGILTVLATWGFKWNMDSPPNQSKNNPGISFPVLSLLVAGSIFILWQIYFVFQAAYLRPIATWDGIYAIAVKSKYFYYGGHLEGLKNFYLTSSYPIQTELDMTWVALVLGRWDDQWVKLIFPVILSAYLLAQYGLMRRITDFYRAFFSCLFVAGSYFLITHGSIEYRAVLFMAYNLLTVFFIYHYFQDRQQPAIMIFSGIWAGLGAFVKLEGLGHIFIFLALIVFLYRKTRVNNRKLMVKTLICFLLPALMIALPFVVIKNVYQLGNFEGRLVPVFHGWLERLPVILAEIADNLFLSGNWNILWFILFVFILTSKRAGFKKIEVQYFGLALFLYFMMYITLGLLTSTYEPLYGNPLINLSRTILHFFPLCPILIVLLV